MDSALFRCRERRRARGGDPGTGTWCDNLSPAAHRRPPITVKLDYEDSAPRELCETSWRNNGRLSDAEVPPSAATAVTICSSACCLSKEGPTMRRRQRKK